MENITPLSRKFIQLSRDIFSVKEKIRPAVRTKIQSRHRGPVQCMIAALTHVLYVDDELDLLEIGKIFLEE
ncbi:MAG: hypothetical protein WCF90_08730 [Methanomicrobiales archaeon]